MLSYIAIRRLEPFKPSKFPFAGSFRVCTIGHFAFAADSKKTFTLLNAHLDNVSDAQRCMGASLLLARARYEAVKTGAPVFITGDLNSSTAGKDSGAYDILTGTQKPVAIPLDFAAKYRVDPDELPDFKMLDLRGQSPRMNVSANFATFTGFKRPTDTREWTRIDFIFGGSNRAWTVQNYRVVSALFDDGLLASDHRPVFTDISI